MCSSSRNNEDVNDVTDISKAFKDFQSCSNNVYGMQNNSFDHGNRMFA
jgi:hypothetical protein